MIKHNKIGIKQVMIKYGMEYRATMIFLNEKKIH